MKLKQHDEITLNICCAEFGSDNSDAEHYKQIFPILYIFKSPRS